MEFVSMDLIGEFHPTPPPSKGNRYALTAVCMLTGYTFCISLKNKSAEEILTAWRNHIAFPFGVCRKLLTDNGTKFKNDLFSRVTEQLHTGHNQMVGLRDSINSSKVVYLNIFLDTESGMMWCHWSHYCTTAYQTSTPKNPHFSSCLIETH